MLYHVRKNNFIKTQHILCRCLLIFLLVCVLCPLPFLKMTAVGAVTLSYAEGGVMTEDPGYGLTADLCRYVDSVNGDDNNNGQSSSSAWRTLSKVASQSDFFSDGTHILLKRGCSWNEYLSISNMEASEGNRIVIGAYGCLTDNRPIIDASSSTTGMIRLSGCSYITIRDIELEQIICRSFSNNVLVYNNIVHGMSTSSVSNGIYCTSGTHHIAIVSNFVYDIGQNDSISIHEQNWVPYTAIGDAFWVADNTIIGNQYTEEGIDVATGEVSPLGKDYKIIGNHIAMNALSNFGTKTGAGISGIAVGHSGSNYWIIGNIISRSTNGGIYVNDGPETTINHALQISGNIVFNCGTASPNNANVIYNASTGIVRNNTFSNGISTRENLNLGVNAYDATITRNVILSTSGTWLNVLRTDRSESITTMDNNWYGNITIPTLDGLSWNNWLSSTPYDQNSATGFTTGVTIPLDTTYNNDPRNWTNSDFLDHFIPDSSWIGNNLNNGVVGAYNSLGEKQGMVFEPMPEVDNYGYGWRGPLIIQIRYPLPPVTVTFETTADASVLYAKPDNNCGTQSTLSLNASSSYMKYGFLKFDVSNITDRVSSAKLKLYFCGTNTPDSTTRVWASSTTSWLETGITWNNKPQNITLITTFNNPPTQNVWIEADVTDYISGNGTYSFELIPECTRDLLIATKEYSDVTYRPSLEITFVP